ncbi:hypothetical protein, partial [Salmonella sp. gx-f7]|uniref:hypothetical protein n=1 Tax=Salmonella sp. gx-f7 TaxID=2582606 RepID=UPI001F34329A
LIRSIKQLIRQAQDVQYLVCVSVCACLCVFEQSQYKIGTLINTLNQTDCILPTTNIREIEKDTKSHVLNQFLMQ